MTYSLPIAYHALTDSLQTIIFSQGIARYRKNYCAHVVWGVWWGLRMTRSCEQHPTLRHRLNIWNGLMVSSRMGGGHGQPERTAWQTPTEGPEWAQKTNHYLAPTLVPRTVRGKSVGAKKWFNFRARKVGPETLPASRPRESQTFGGCMRSV